MGRLRGLIFLISGVVLMVIGLGMWKSPELDWEGFLGAWVMIGDEILRLIDDPFAILGILVLVVGFLVVASGLRRLVRG